MRLGVISDTHGQVEFTLAAIRKLEELNVDTVLHCGDIGSEAIVPLFSRWPTHFVFGNVDHDEVGMRMVIESAGKTCHGRFGSLEIEGVRIALLHSDDERLFEETIRSGEFQLVCHGHTHRAEHRRIGTTLVLNPGAMFRAPRHTIAVVDLPALKVTPVIVE